MIIFNQNGPLGQLARLY